MLKNSEREDRKKSYAKSTSQSISKDRNLSGGVPLGKPSIYQKIDQILSLPEKRADLHIVTGTKQFIAQSKTGDLDSRKLSADYAD
jgi:hypothetical protein